MCKKEGESATSCLNIEGIYAVFCNIIQTALQAIWIWKKSIEGAEIYHSHRKTLLW